MPDYYSIEIKLIIRLHKFNAQFLFKMFAIKMIKINLKPSFHTFSSITLNQDEVEYEILPTLLDLKGLDKKEKLLTSEYLELKKIKAFNEIAKEEYFSEKNKIPNAILSEKVTIEKLLNQIIEKPTIDKRMMLDGIEIECVVNHSNSEPKIIEFRSPETDTREHEIIKSLFIVLKACFKEEPVLDHIKLMQSYFSIGNR